MLLSISSFWIQQVLEEMPDNQFWPVRISIYHPRGPHGNVDIVKYYNGKDPVQLINKDREFVKNDKDITSFRTHKNPKIEEMWNFDPFDPNQESVTVTYTVATNEADGRLLLRKYSQVMRGRGSRNSE